MKRFKSLLIFICFTLILLGLIALLFIYNKKPETEIDYCIELEEKLEDLKLEQFKYYTIEYRDENRRGKQLISICFGLKNNDKYIADENGTEVCASDIAIVRNAIAEYLNDTPNNELNTKNIMCCFDKLPGDTSYMYNYNYMIDEKSPEPDGFYYYYNVFLNIQNADLFKDAKVMSAIRVDNSDELRLLEDWNNLEYVSLYGIEFSEQDKDYLHEILPNTTINW